MKAKNVALAYVHTIIILAAYTSPFWLDFRIIIIGTIIYWLQILVFKACVVAILQYGNADTSFSATHIGGFLERLGISITEKRLRFVLDWIWPEVIIALAIYLQLFAGLVPFFAV